MKIEKHYILNEIKRIATANGGKAPGRLVFERETGIKYSDWQPYIWLRWNEALDEAGYAPNQLSTRIDDQIIIESYISLVRELHRFPVSGEIRRKARSDRSFPSAKLFDRFGGKEKLIEKVVAYCESKLAFRMF